MKHFIGLLYFTLLLLVINCENGLDADSQIPYIEICNDTAFYTNSMIRVYGSATDDGENTCELFWKIDDSQFQLSETGERSFLGGSGAGGGVGGGGGVIGFLLRKWRPGS